MKVAYQDLKRFFVDNISLEEISEKLFQLGHEHEIDNDIYDIEFTPNRGDCLSLLGLARELKVFYDIHENFEIYNNDVQPLELDFENLSPNDAPLISFLEIEIDNPPKKYKEYLESYFNSLGIKKNNFFTDISNYISYELGQPTHCFDSKKINGQISFISGNFNKKFKTLLDTEIKLSGQNCIFKNNNEIVSLAGIMGGKQTSCSSNTTKVLVECAYFNPESIIGKSIKYNLNSDAAYKFERGVDYKCHELVFRRFIKIIEEHTEIKDLSMSFYKAKEIFDRELDIDIHKINDILGTSISKEFFTNTLKKLGFEINNKIKIPSYRNDISSQNDLAEEVARVIGYNNINRESIKIDQIKKPHKNETINLVKSFLIKEGFYEVINYPFSDEKKSNSILIDNPLDLNKPYIRSDLRGSLIKNLLYNERRQKDSVKLFEISDVYFDEITMQSNLKLGIVASGRLGNNHKQFSKKIDDIYLNNLLIKLFSNSELSFKKIDRDSLDTKIKNNLYYIELELDDIRINKELFKTFKKNKPSFKKYNQTSDYPMSSRDFSFSISDPNKYDDVIDNLESINDKHIKSYYIFDFYKNEASRELKLGVRFNFQSQEYTLSDKQIQESIDNILEPIINIDGVSVPGL